MRAERGRQHRPAGQRRLRLGNYTTAGFAGYSSAFHVLSANVGILPVGGSATIFVTVIPTAVGALKTTGVVFSSNFDTNVANNTATVSTTAINLPGTFALSSSSYAVNENGGSVPITIQRLNGTLGAVDVTFTTGDGTAKAGVNYTANSGVVRFAAGETSKTVLIPVRRDGAITGNLTFFFAITGVDNKATVGAPASAAVTVVNVDRDLVPPLVESVVPVEVGGKVAAYVIDYSKALNPSTAGNANNYHLFLSGRDLGVSQRLHPGRCRVQPGELLGVRRPGVAAADQRSSSG